MACVSAGTLFRTRNQLSSISVINCFSGRVRTSTVSANYVSCNNSQVLSSGMLHSSFLSSSPAFPSTSFFSSSGLSWGVDLTSNNELQQGRGRRLIVRMARKYQLAQTKRNKSRKSLARTHGFRLRMRTTSGRALLKRRRAKGRKILCPKSNPSGGKRM